jgi:3-oxoacyl-[acyl-carrier-protein] synthase II
MVAHGDADIVVTGGADSMINPYHMAGFCLLGALSKRNDDPTKASRPFDAERDGFVLGEGACMMVLEEHDHAVARGAKILGEVCGYGVTESAYRITDLHPEGFGPIEAMQEAIKDAGIVPSDVGYLNAHGTSTLVNDRCESVAVRHVFGTGSVAPKVSSTKSLTGHLISAAGAIELAFCIMALRDQTLPPSANLVSQDPDCPVTLCPAEPTKAALNYALSNSVGFGGSNTALIARRVGG